jgi:hypothetical protein
MRRNLALCFRIRATMLKAWFMNPGIGIATQTSQTRERQPAQFCAVVAHGNPIFGISTVTNRWSKI